MAHGNARKNKAPAPPKRQLELLAPRAAVVAKATAPKAAPPEPSPVPPVDEAEAEPEVRSGQASQAQGHRRAEGPGAARDLHQRVLHQEPPPARFRQRVHGVAHRGERGGGQLARRLRGSRHPSRHHRRGARAGGGPLPHRHRRQRPGHREGPGAQGLRQAALRQQVSPPQAEPRPAGHRHLRRGDVRAADHRQAGARHQQDRQGAAGPLLRDPDRHPQERTGGGLQNSGMRARQGARDAGRDRDDGQLLPPRSALAAALPGADGAGESARPLRLPETGETRPEERAAGVPAGE